MKSSEFIPPKTAPAPTCSSEEDDSTDQDRERLREERKKKKERKVDERSVMRNLFYYFISFQFLRNVDTGLASVFKALTNLYGRFGLKSKSAEKKEADDKSDEKKDNYSTLSIYYVAPTSPAKKARQEQNERVEDITRQIFEVSYTLCNLTASVFEEILSAKIEKYRRKEFEMYSSEHITDHEMSRMKEKLAIHRDDIRELEELILSLKVYSLCQPHIISMSRAVGKGVGGWKSFDPDSDSNI